MKQNLVSMYENLIIIMCKRIILPYKLKSKRYKAEIKEYDDIINFPHHQSTKHAHMSRINRATQFAPFAALTGYGAAINKTARFTNEKLELEEESINILNEQIQLIYERISEKPFVEITYFLLDIRKAGGEYITVSGNVRRIDDFKREIIFTDDLRIPMDDIYSINII